MYLHQLKIYFCVIIIAGYFTHDLGSHAIMFIFITIVISEPDDVSICEGEGTVFSCVLNRISNISNNDVHWYRFLRSRGTTEIVNASGENVSFLIHTGNTLTSNLTITNAIKSYTGYYWVGTPSLTVCNVSLTVVTSTYVCLCVCVCACMRACVCVHVCMRERVCGYNSLSCT